MGVKVLIWSVGSSRQSGAVDVERERKMNALKFEWKLCGTLEEQGISCIYVEATAEVGFRLR